MSEEAMQPECTLTVAFKPYPIGHRFIFPYRAGDLNDVIAKFKALTVILGRKDATVGLGLHELGMRFDDLSRWQVEVHRYRPAPGVYSEETVHLDPEETARAKLRAREIWDEPMAVVEADEPIVKEKP